MERDLQTIHEMVDDFPVSTLYISVHRHERHGDYHVKTSLVLPGKTLFTGDRDVLIHPAYERCIHKLEKKITAYKQRMRGDLDLSRNAVEGRRSPSPTQEFDPEKLEDAIAKDDYAAFRRGLDMFEAGLNDRIGRWVQRYPEVESQLGTSMTISDLVEDVFLTAFQQFKDRPHDVPPGTWIQSLIDPCIRSILHSPGEEFANICFAEALLEGNRDREDRARPRSESHR